MQTADLIEIEAAKKAALEVLLHNAHGPFHGLPRTAGWGYPEPYTRDLMFSILEIAVSEDKKLLESIRKVLETLAKNQKLVALTHCIKISNSGTVEFGFNEWIKAQVVKSMGQQWQTWSATLYLYAAKCVEEKCTPFFDEIRCKVTEKGNYQLQL